MKAKIKASAIAEAKAGATIQAYEEEVSRLIIKGIKPHVKLQN